LTPEENSVDRGKGQPETFFQIWKLKSSLLRVTGRYFL
jgi:hypothetical protein